MKITAYNIHDKKTPKDIIKCVNFFYYKLKPLHRNHQFEGKWGFCEFALCGGAITSYFTKTRINDIDLFFESNYDFRKAKQILIEDGYECKFENDIVCNMHKNYTKIQLCKIKYAVAEKILESFDIVCCCAAIRRNVFICHSNFMMDVKYKKLNFNNLDKPRNTLIRIPKYIRKGFNITYYNLHLLANAIKDVEVDIDMTTHFADGSKKNEGALVLNLPINIAASEESKNYEDIF